MTPLNLNEIYLIEDILNRQETDHNKYLFTWDQDIAWEDSDFGSEVTLLNQYYEAEDDEKFMELYNKVYESPIFKVVKIYVMKGPGGAWPDARCQTTKLMTIKDFVHTYRLRTDCEIEDYIFDLTPVKVEECDE